MNYKNPCATAIAAAVLASLYTPSALATRNPCMLSAWHMSKSCMFETKEEVKATKAKCVSIASQEERIQCLAEAVEERDEASETCKSQLSARRDACDLLQEERYADPLVDREIDFIDPDEIGENYNNNPYVILQAGHTHVLRAEEEIVVVYATDEVRDIQGVDCRVIVDIVVEEEFDEDEQKWEYEAIEVTDDWFAQDTNDNVYYCGEVAQNFEDGVLRDLDGSFESGVDLASGGILTLAAPAPGQVHRTEYSLGEAEDVVQYLSLGASPTDEEGGENEAFPCNESCLKTFDFAPLEPESTEYKYYLPGIGFVLAISLEDGEIEEDGREELVCEGASLDILADDACEIEDPEELRGELCDLHDELCADGEDD